MKKMKLMKLLLLFLLPLCLGLSMQEDDLVFDDVGEETPTAAAESEPRQHQQSRDNVSLKEKTTSSTTLPKYAKKWQRNQKLLPIRDSIATVGHVFKFRISKDIFIGNLDYFEAHGLGSKTLPRWLRWDEPANVLSGVPSRKDLARNPISITAYGKNEEVAQGSFTIHVVPENRERYKHGDGKKSCREEQDRTMLTILIDARYDSLNPSTKVNALENLAGFLGLHTSSLSMYPDSEKLYFSSPLSNGGSSVVLSGPGNISRRREKHSTLVQWQVGCDGHFWPHEINTIKLIPEQAMDGTLSEVMQLPVYQWRVWSDSNGYERNRRETTGSGDNFLPDEEEDEYDEEEYDDEDYDTNEGITESPQQPKQKTTGHQRGVVDEHPHRHHHGEDSIAGIGADINNEEDFVWRNEGIDNAIFNSTTASATTSSTPSTIAVTLSPSSTSSPSTSILTSTSTSTSTPTPTPTPTSSSSSTTTTTTTTTTTEAAAEITTTPPSPSTTKSASATATATSDSSTTTTTTSIATAESSNSSITPQEPSNPTIANATTTTTTTTTARTTFDGTIESLTTETPVSSADTNATQPSTNSVFQSTSSNNVSTDVHSTMDNEDSLTTKEDLESETESDITTSMQPNIFVVSESTTASGSGASIAEGLLPTFDPNVTSILTVVNSTTEEYTDAFVPSREIPLIVNFTTSQWNDNVTESVPARSFNPVEGIHIPEYNSTNSTTSTTTLSTTISTTPSTVIVPNTTTSESTTMPSSTNTTTKMPESTSTTTTMSTTTTTTTTTMMTTTTTTTAAITKQPQPSTTETLKIEYGVRNFPPKVESRLKKIPVTQGKLLSYTIPEDAFSDPEDGNTRQLRLRIYEKGAPLKPTYWLQFNEDTQEVYGLPLEEYYGPFAFEIRAIDSEGLTASNRLDVSVQQHKQIRAMNHEFHLYLKIEKRSEFKTNVDWELKVMRSLAELYGDADLSYITVRSIDIDRDQAIYTWTNDSLARSSTCPQEEINRLYRVLVHDEKTEDPSEGLIRVLGPEIKPKRVVYQGLEQCQQSKETQINKFPVPRNQIDQLNATVGQLFVYRVPKDTFFDEEDGDTGSMKASLLTANRTEIPQWDWLQFDSNNQEFYGVPLKQDIGRKTYQLIVKDKEGLEATDSLVAEVHSAPLLRHVVEISMTLNMPLEAFAHSALKKREFIHKLQRLYGDKNASAISILSINGNHDTTTVIWRNLSLPTKECPSDEITRLRRVLVNDNKSFSDELDREFNSDSHQPDFAVIQITVGSTGACGNVGIGRPEMPPLDDSTSVGATHDDYLITFVLPAIIIVAMLLLAGLIACILYKRRRSGKMSVSEKDDERQSFRSKGIPVIFQDELDEKPDPGNKSPIILKEEKPPLPPPEYQRAEDGADIPMLSKENSEEPYQPPPPFATNRENSRQNRPKPTPTYRKPPPYVPP